MRIRMPRKHREIRAGLEKKGFSVEENRKHIHFVYVDLEGRTTTARTMISHESGASTSTTVCSAKWPNRSDLTADVSWN
jgi:hypothetical protein